MEGLKEKFNIDVKSKLEIGGSGQEKDELKINHSQFLIGTPGRIYELLYT